MSFPSITDEMRPFFSPTGVAVVGARRSQGFGYGVPLILIERGWGDRLYLVNPKGGRLHGQRVYKTLAEVPDPVDLAIVIVPAPSVPKVLVEIAQRGIRHVIIETAGFAETNGKGKALQEEIKAIQSASGLRVIGPNCVGVVNNSNGFCSTEIIPEAFTPGNIGIIAQSGVFGNILLDKFCLLDLNVSKAITLGNRLDVNESEMLEFLRQDPGTQVIVLYLEGAANGRRLTEVLARTTLDKPVLVLKSGRSEEGRAATASHTGSLSGVDRLYGGMFRQTGAVRADGLTDLIALTRMFSTQPLPLGGRLGIVTGSGSMGALATDHAIDSGLQVPPPSEDTVGRIREAAPEWMNVKNPLDVGPSGMMPQAIAAMMQDPGIDMVLAIVTIPQAVIGKLFPEGNAAEVIFGGLRSVRRLAPEKPVAISVVAHDSIKNGIREIVGGEVPVFDAPELVIDALADMWRYAQWRGTRRDR